MNRPLWFQHAFWTGLVAAGVLAAPAAHADDVTAEQAQQLQQQIHDWLATVVGPKAPLPEAPVQVSAEDDHCNVSIPVAGTYGTAGVSVEGDPVSAQVKSLDGGRWSIDEIKGPSPLKLRLQLPGAPAANSIEATIDEQTQHAILDPSLASPSNFDSTLKGYNSISVGVQDGEKRVTHIDQIVTHLTWQPAGDGRIDILEDASSHTLTMSSDLPNVGPTSFTAEQVKVVAHMDGVAPDRVPTILHAIFDVAAMANAPEAKKPLVNPAGKPKLTPGKVDTSSNKMPPAAHAQVHKALVALTELIGAFDEQITTENLHLDVGGHSGSASRIVAGLGVHASSGKLGLRINLTLDGLDSPEIPPGAFHTFLPKHVSLAPRISGIPTSDLSALMLRAADSEGNDPALQAQAEALLHKGPVLIGLDDVAIDAGPATLQASGEMKILARDSYSGVAHIAVTNFDELIKQSSAMPELAQAGPVMIFLKGIGQQNGAVTVWDISYTDKKLVVNGTDMSQMIPGGGQ